MQYTLTKYLTADYLRENDFLRAYLELVDEIIFCCSMESLDVLSTMSFENMDDNYFLAYMNFFLNGLSTYDVNKLDKLILSEWFSLLHVRGELSDIDKLLKFGGSLKNKEKNVFELYHNADVPNQTIDTTKDGLIYLITENNIDLDQDYLITQQVPAGYRIGLMKTPPPALVRSGDVIYLGEKNVDASIHVDAGDVVNLHKDFEGDITFYRRRQFDQYYTFGEVYRSQYTINQLSQYHRSGYYFFGFEVEHFVPLPSDYSVENDVYGCLDSTYGEFFIADGQIVNPQSFIYSGSFEYPNSFVTLADLNFEDGRINLDDTIRNNYSLIDNLDFGYGDVIDFNSNLRNNYDFINSTTEFPGGKFVSRDDFSFDGMFEHPVFISTNVLNVFVEEPLYISQTEVVFGGIFITGDDVIFANKKDLGGVINKNNSSKQIFDLINWSSSGVVEKSVSNKQIFDLIGWMPSGYFPEEEQDNTAKSYIVINNGVVIQSIDVDDTFIHQIEQNVEIVNFYFTQRGSNETKDSLLESGATIPLYNADGTLANEAQYDGVGTVTFTQSNGNMFETPSYSNLVVLSNGNLVLRTNTSYKANSVQLEKSFGIRICGKLTSNSDSSVYSKNLLCGVIDKSSIEILLGIRWDVDNGGWLSKTFQADDWWWAGILSQDDATRLQQFGADYLTNSSASYQWAGTIGNLQYDGEYFDYELIGMYSDIDGLNAVTFDPSNFKLLPRNNDMTYYPTGLVIQSIDAFSTSVMSYKLRIKKINTKKGYLSSDKSSVTISPNTTPYPLYDDNGQLISYNSSKAYKLRALKLSGSAYGRALYEYDNLKLGSLQYYNGKLSLKGGYASPTVGYVCYIEDSINDHDVLDLLLAFSYNGGSFSSVTFSSGTQKWAELLNTDDVARLNAFGLSEIYDGTPYGEVGYSDDYIYVPLALYADINGTQLNTDDMSNFYCEYYSSTNVISIKAINAYSTPSMTWKLRIIKKH